jgi:hypothetical protein
VGYLRCLVDFSPSNYIALFFSMGTLLAKQQAGWRDVIRCYLILTCLHVAVASPLAEPKPQPDHFISAVYSHRTILPREGPDKGTFWYAKDIIRQNLDQYVLQMQEAAKQVGALHSVQQLRPGSLMCLKG